MMGEKPDLNAVFNKAIELASEEDRALYLQLVCADDSQLRARVEALLRAHSEAGGFFGGKPADPGATEPQPSQERPGTQMGPYKLLQQIGAGGMGVVYLAEQSRPVQRRVALKIIKPGMDTQQVIARFNAERQALAMMDHPNIARVLDAGTTASGRPFFVMELVNGLPVTQFCDEQHLSARERLELFIPICEAVQHAHQKGIIHRDIKPNNILVALYDGRPVPKVIDFGVAKAISQRLTEQTLFTALGQIVGTVEYMSPEQAMRNQLDVDTRSDVYSLGVVLYELLTGDTPFDKMRLRSAAWDEILRIIREEEPPRPSNKLSSSEKLPSVAANRRIEPGKLSAMIRGELDWIVIKSLEKDRARRYQSPSQFAADVRNYLNDQTVLACPPSSSYKLRKFLRRHSKGVVVSLLLVSSLILGLMGTLSQARRARQSENIMRASLEAQESARREESVQRKRAEETMREGQRRLSRLYVAEGNRQVAAMDPFAALPWFMAAIDVDREDQQRQALHRLRINSILDQSPKLNHVLQHEAPVDCAAFSRDGLRLATGSRDGFVNVWDVASGRRLQGPFRHAAGVRFVAFSDDGRRLLTTSGERWQFQPHIGQTLQLWSLTNGQPVFPPVEYDGVISFVQLTPDAQRVLALHSREVFRDYYRHSARLIDAANGQLLQELFTAETSLAASQAAVSPDGHNCAVAFDRKLSVFATDDGKLLWPVKQLEADADQLAFDLAGDRLAVGTVQSPGESQSQETEFRVWSVQTGESIGSTLKPGCQAATAWFSNNGHRVGVVGRSGSFWIGDIESGRREDETHTKAIWRGDSAQPMWISPTRSHLATTFVTDWPGLGALQGCQLWNLLSGKPLPYTLHHAGAIIDARFHPDGHLLATCGEDRCVRVWNLARQLPTVPSTDFLYPWEYIDWLRLSDDNQRILVGYSKVGIQLWDTHTGKTISPTQPIRDSNGPPYFVSPDCRQLYYQSRNSIRRMDVASGTSQTIVSQLAEEQYSLRYLVHFLPQRHYVATRAKGAVDLRWQIWSVDDHGANVVELPDYANGYLQWSAFSPNGRYFALASNYRDGQIVVFDTATGSEVVRSDVHDNIDEPIEHMVVVFSPDESRLVVGRSFGHEKGQIDDSQFVFQVLDLERGRSVIPPIISDGFLREARFSKDSRQFLLCADSRRLKWAETTKSDWNEVSIWSSGSGKRVGEELRHPDHALANFSHNGRMIATTCDDATVRIWDVSTGTALATYHAREPLTGEIAFTSSDNMLALSTAASTVHVIDPRTGEAITPPLVAPGNLHELRFSEGDRELLAVSRSQGGPVLMRWSLDETVDDLSAARLSKWLSLHTIDDSGAAAPLTESQSNFEFFNSDLYRSNSSGTSDDRRLVAWHQQLSSTCANVDYRDGAIFNFEWLCSHDRTAWKPLLNRGAVQQRRTYYYTAFERRPNWSAVIADYSAAIQRAPDEMIARRFRVEASAASGMLPAKDDLEQIWQHTADFEAGCHLAILHLAMGDIGGYRAQCEALLKSLPLASEKEVMTIWVCLLIPHALKDLHLVLDRSEAAMADEERRSLNGISTNYSITRNYAAALLRSDRAAEAITALVQCTKKWEGDTLPEVWSLLSLAYAQTGNDQESAVWRAKAIATFEEQGKQLEWTHREILNALLSEGLQSEKAQ